jgi:hypothetical protein
MNRVEEPTVTTWRLSRLNSTEIPPRASRCAPGPLAEHRVDMDRDRSRADARRCETVSVCLCAVLSTAPCTRGRGIEQHLAQLAGGHLVGRICASHSRGMSVARAGSMPSPCSPDALRSTLGRLGCEHRLHHLAPVRLERSLHGPPPTSQNAGCFRFANGANVKPCALRLQTRRGEGMGSPTRQSCWAGTGAAMCRGRSHRGCHSAAVCDS